MSKASERRPHVIWLHSDQHNARMMGCVEGSWVRTPHLDRLASAGTRFTAAYCASPLCGPSRMSMLTGRMPSEINVELNSQALASHIPTIAHSLGGAGYHPVLCGRMHFVGPDQRHGFVERLVGDHGPTDAAQREQPMGLFDGTTGQDGGNLTSSGPGVSSVMLYDEAVTEAACDYVSGYAGASPLFLSVGWYGPHNPFVCPERLYGYYAEATPRISREQRLEWIASAHPAVREWLESRDLLEVDEAVMHRARAAYSGLVEFLDEQVGRVIDAAAARFDMRDVLVIYSSDHGEMMGERGMFWKSSFFEGAAATPWVWSWPGVIERQNCGEAVSLLDLAPTLGEFVSAPGLPKPDGCSLASVLTGRGPAPRRPIVSTLADMRCGASAMVRYGSMKLIRYHGHAQPLLYDVQRDPRERTDLAGDEGYAQQRRELDGFLRERWSVDRSLDAIAHASEARPLLRQWANQLSPARFEHWRADLNALYLKQPEDASVAGDDDAKADAGGDGA